MKLGVLSALVCALVCVFHTILWHQQTEAAAPPAPRGDWVGDPLPSNAIARLGTGRLRHTADVWSVAWSPDGRWFASVDYYGEVRLWDAETGRLVSVPVKHPKRGRVVRFSHDGKTLVISGADGVVRFLRLSDGKLRQKEFDGEQYALALSRDGKWLAFQTGLSKVTVAPMDESGSKFSLQDTAGGIGALAFSPDGSFLASCSRLPKGNNNIRLWSMKTGKLDRELKPSARRVAALEFDPKRSILYSTHGDETIRVWDVVKREEVLKIATPYDRALAVSPDGKLLASARNATACIWNAETGKAIRTIDDCGGGIHSLAFSPDSKKLLTGSTYRALRVWDVETGKEVNPRQGHHDAVQSLAFSPDGKALASRGSDQTVRVWDLKKAKQVRVLSTGKAEQHHALSVMDFRRPASIAYSPDGKFLAAAGGMEGPIGKPSNYLFLWDAAQFRARRLDQSPGVPSAVAFSPDGKTLAADCGAGYVRLWDVARAEALALTQDPNHDRRSSIGTVAYSPDGRTLAIAMRTKVLLWDALAGKAGISFAAPVKRGGSDLGAHCVAFSPDGQLLAVAEAVRPDDEKTGYGDRVVHLYEAASGGVAGSVTINLFEAVPRAINAVAFSPDGRLLAFAESGGLVSVWDVFTRKRLAAFAGHDGQPLCVAFSPDGKTLASGGMDTTILLWDVSKVRPTAPSAGKAGVKELADEMAGKDVGKAYDAVWRLAGHGDKAVEHLKPTLKPVARLDAAKVKRLVGQLEDEQQARRDEAVEELTKLGRVVEPALRRVLANKPPNQTRRLIAGILDRWGAPKAEQSDLVQARSLLVLELVGSKAARAVLADLAAGEPDAPLTRSAAAALARLR
jgi:WD40 repeat protein